MATESKVPIFSRQTEKVIDKSKLTKEEKDKLTFKGDEGDEDENKNEGY